MSYEPIARIAYYYFLELYDIAKNKVSSNAYVLSSFQDTIQITFSKGTFPYDQYYKKAQQYCFSLDKDLFCEMIKECGKSMWKNAHLMYHAIPTHERNQKLHNVYTMFCTIVQKVEKRKNGAINTLYSKEKKLPEHTLYQSFEQSEESEADQRSNQNNDTTDITDTEKYEKSSDSNDSVVIDSDNEPETHNKNDNEPDVIEGLDEPETDENNKYKQRHWRIEDSCSETRDELVEPIDNKPENELEATEGLDGEHIDDDNYELENSDYDELETNENEYRQCHWRTEGPCSETCDELLEPIDDQIQNTYWETNMEKNNINNDNNDNDDNDDNDDNNDKNSDDDNIEDDNNDKKSETNEGIIEESRPPVGSALDALLLNISDDEQEDLRLDPPENIVYSRSKKPNTRSSVGSASRQKSISKVRLLDK